MAGQTAQATFIAIRAQSCKRRGSNRTVLMSLPALRPTILRAHPRERTIVPVHLGSEWR